MVQHYFVMVGYAKHSQGTIFPELWYKSLQPGLIIRMGTDLFNLAVCSVAITAKFYSK